MQISQNQYQILVYNSEIWPENQLAYTKSNKLGFISGGSAGLPPLRCVKSAKMF